MIGSEEVLLARIVFGPQASASCREQPALQVEILRCGLDHQVAFGEVGEAVGAAGAAARRIGFGLAPPSLGDPLGRGPVQLLQARLEGGGDRVVEPGLVSAQRRDLGDPGAHRAGADDPDVLDLQLALEFRLALLEEGGHALDPVLGRHRQLVEAPLVLEPGGEGGLLGDEHGLLGEPGGDRRALGDGRGERHRLLQPAAALDDLVDQAQLQRGRGVEALAGEHELHRSLLAEHPRQALGATAAGDDSEVDLRLAELGALGGDDHVAGERQLAAAAQRVAGDGGDHRRLDRGEAAPEGGGRVAQRLGEAALRHRLDVGAGGEDLLGAGDDDAAHLGVGVEPLQLARPAASISSGERALRASGRLSRSRAT